MNEYKELFKKVITKEIENSQLKSFALYCVEKIPSYFWTIPASSSGKYHPVTDLGYGGLVRHSLMVLRVAIDLINATNDTTIIEMKDEILFSCLFHDCCKNGLENSGHTEHTHPIIAADFITKLSLEYMEEVDKYFNFIMIERIHEMIASHMGKWTSSKYSEIELPAPKFTEEIFVHQCDYIASRIYCIYDGDFFDKY